MPGPHEILVILTIAFLMAMLVVIPAAIVGLIVYGSILVVRRRRGRTLRTNETDGSES